MNYSFNFYDGIKFQLYDDNEDGIYNIKFIDSEKDIIIYDDNIKPGEWASPKIKYYIKWRTIVSKDNEILLDYTLDLNNINVFILFESNSLGDSIAWVPYIEEFRKKHNCIVYARTNFNYLFEDEYSDINFFDNDSIDDIGVIYRIGWYNKTDKNPNDVKKIPLQQTITDILGLEYKEIIPKIKKVETKERNFRYVCLAKESTANAKHWHYPYVDGIKGWQVIVDWLNSLGYKVMVISKQPTTLTNIIDKTGDIPLEDRMTDILGCEFFIGIGSGLSWLSWALNKKVVMISGFSDPICEFKSNNTRIINKNVCNSCFNKYQFDRGDWNWCPVHRYTDKHFECSTNITPRMVAEKMIEDGLVKDNGFNFDMNYNHIDMNIDDIKVYYDKNDNKVKLENLSDYIPIGFCYSIKNEHDTILYNSYLGDFKKIHTYWSSIKEDKIEKEDKIYIDFYDMDKYIGRKIVNVK